MNRDDQLMLGEGRRLLRDLRSLGEVSAPPSNLGAVLARTGLGDAYWRLESPIGPVYVAWNSRGISAIMAAEDGHAFERAFQARFHRPAHRIGQPPGRLARLLAGRLRGERGRRLSFDLRGLTDFQRAVLMKALEIPRGEVRPYSWIAREIGRPGAVRAVGSALGDNPVPLLIPCHRVVRSDGRIGGYAFGSDAKRALLRGEGIDPEEVEHLARSGVRYFGSDTTHIYCFPTCRHARRVSERHRVTFSSEDEAVAAGYRACRVCRPAVS